MTVSFLSSCRSALTAIGFAAALATPHAAAAQTIVAQASPGSFFENVALGPDGAFYITNYTGKQILRHSAKDGTSVFATIDNHPIGIVFDADGTLYFSAQEKSLFGGGGDMTNGKLIYRAGKGEQPKLFMTANEVNYLNGWTRLAPGRLLAADSRGGVIWELDTKNGKLSKFLSDPLLDTPDPKLPTPAANGVKVNGGYVYVTNTVAGKILRAKLDAQARPGEVEVAYDNARADDFDFSPRGTLYFTTHRDKVFRIVAGKIEEFVSTATAPAISGSTTVIWDADGKGPYVLSDGGFVGNKWYKGPEPGPSALVRFEAAE